MLLLGITVRIHGFLCVLFRMKISLLLNFTRQDLIERYSGSVLGGLWSFIVPLVNILMFFLVFSKIMGAKLGMYGLASTGYGYSIYLVSGILSWNAFAAILLRTTNIYKDKAGIIAKVNISLLSLPVYIVLSETIIFIISMMFYMLFLIWIGLPITEHWLILPFVYLLQALFAYTLGFVCATLSVFIKDIREFIAVIIQLWFWATPVVYIADILPEEVQYWFQFNPMYQILSAYRVIIIEHQYPQFSELSVLLGFSCALLLISIYIFKKLEKDLRDFI